MMDDRRQTRVGMRKDRIRMNSCSLSRSPHLSFSSTSISTSFFRFQVSFLPSRSRCQISFAPFSLSFYLFLVLVSFFLIPLVFEIDAMLPNELLLPPLFIDHELNF